MKGLQTTVDFESTEQRKKFNRFLQDIEVGVNDAFVALTHMFNTDKAVREQVKMVVAGIREGKKNRKVRTLS